MTTPRTVYIDGVALWAPALPDWPTARAALRGDAMPAATAAAPGRRPAPALLAANERRRAPDSVALALEVASAAVADSGHDAKALASVFTSAHGDLPIIDALCTTLASDPLLLSPTRFHHSVHNAASGYWAIASGSQAASTALAAFDHSFAAGLLEAASLCATDDAPVLLVACDTAASGGLASVNRSRGLLALALVLAPWPGARSRWALRWQTRVATTQVVPLKSDAARGLAGNAMADALPLAQALALATAAPLALPLGPSLHLELHLQPYRAASHPAAAA
ncbi:MAG: beta-ketoacyl synthase chain length factor [Rubrivivax sp.]|nr:beta-ketoacyl synthase chain length factor [Rubrivivax sp.]